MGYITIESRPASFSLNPFDHAYLVYTNDAGDELVIRGGPIPSDPTILVSVNVPLDSTLDNRRNGDTPADRGAVVLDLGGRSAEDVWLSMTNHAAQIANYRIDYNAFYQNSNSLVASVLAAVGIDFQSALAGRESDPASHHPAYGNNLDYTYDFVENIFVTNEEGPREQRDYTFVGGENADSLHGGHGNDTIHGFAGDDLIRVEPEEPVLVLATAPTLVLEAPAGHNLVYAGDGNDTVFAGSGNDEIFGEAGNDLLVGGTEASSIALPNPLGAGEMDILDGGSGNDFIAANAKFTVLKGGTGNDIHIASSNVNYHETGIGDDTIVVGRGVSIIDASAGNTGKIVLASDNPELGFELRGGIGDSEVDTETYSWSNLDHIIYTPNPIGSDSDDPDLPGGPVDGLPTLSGIIPFGAGYPSYGPLQFSINTGVDTPFEIQYTSGINISSGLVEKINSYIPDPSYHYIPSENDLLIYTLLIPDSLGNTNLGINEELDTELGTITIIKNFTNGDFGISLLEDAGFRNGEGERNGEYYNALNFIANNGDLVPTHVNEGTNFGTQFDFGADLITQGIPNIEIAEDDQPEDEFVPDEEVASSEGNERLLNTPNSELFIGATSEDVVVYRDEVVIDLSNQTNNGGSAGADRFTGIERFVLGNGSDDAFIGDDEDNWVSGRDGDDVLVGGSGDDRLVSGSGSDYLSGGDGNDVLVVEGLANFISGDDGDDHVNFVKSDTGMYIDLLFGETSNADTILSVEHATGTNHDDEIFGNNLANTLRGLQGDDIIFGEQGNDRLVGFEGNDTLDGGLGNDRLLGGTGSDTFVFSKGSGRDVLVDFAILDDTIVFEGFGELTGSDLFSLSSVSNGGNLVMNFGEGDRLVILDVDETIFDTLDYQAI